MGDRRGARALESLWRIAAFDPQRRERLPFGEEAFDPRVARQGGRLLYSRRTYDVNIWRIALEKTQTGGSEPVKLASSTLAETYPEYSPDGRRIALVSRRSGQSELWICGSDATGARSLAAASPSSPRWSPDGRRIVFVSEGHIHTISVDGGVPQRLTSDQAPESAPSYSRDSRWVYFGCQRPGQVQICKVPSTGGSPVEITRGGGSYPLESYDGKWVFYTKSGATTWGGPLWKVPAAGGQEVETTVSVLRRADFAVTDRGVYYIPFDDPDKPAEVRLFDPVSGANSHVATLPRRQRMTATGLSISPDHHWALFSLHDLQMDLMLVENFR